VRKPKPRNLVFGVLLALAFVGAGLVIAQDQETLRVRTSLAATDPRFPEYLARLLGHPLTTGDRYIVHTDGPAAFPAMLAAIDRAARRISFETYIFDAGDVGEQFTAAFERAARRGVSVRLVLDAIGAKTIDAAHLKRLESAGCKIGWFNSVGSYSLEEINYRTHRKALVIDGDVAFVGGMGIADHWARDDEDYRRWRDTQVEISGAAAMNVEAAFNENWIETGGIVDPDVLTHTAPAEARASSIVVWSSPEGGTNAMKLLYLLAIAAARETLDIQSPYLITDESTGWSIAEARGRGVRVRMLTEGDVTDAKPVKFASRATYEPLMEKGVAIYEYQPAMMHTKAIVIDGVLSIVGSANFDNRSLELNDELNVAIFDRETSARLTQDFERDITQSRRLELEEWRNRPFHIRGREKMWSLFGEIF
jgi:cardiolipin synthase A/B